jgi:hypothetical protein
MAIQIGVGVGMRIILSDDGSASFRGGDRDDVIAAAALQVRSRNLPDEKVAFIKQWLTSIVEAIEKEDLDHQVEEEHTKRMKTGAREYKKLSPDLRVIVEAAIRDSANKAVLERSAKKLE